MKFSFSFHSTTTTEKKTTQKETNVWLSTIYTTHTRMDGANPAIHNDDIRFLPRTVSEWGGAYVLALSLNVCGRPKIEENKTERGEPWPAAAIIASSLSPEWKIEVIRLSFGPVTAYFLTTEALKECVCYRGDTSPQVQRWWSVLKKGNPQQQRWLCRELRRGMGWSSLPSTILTHHTCSSSRNRRNKLKKTFFFFFIWLTALIIHTHSYM